MLEALTSALARSVDLPDIPALQAEQVALAERDRTIPKRGFRAAAPPPPNPSSRPVLQLAKLPFTMDPAVYKNAFASTNPGGDMRPAFAFRDLVDPIPFFQPDYVPNAISVEETYGDIVNGAQAASSLSQTMLSRAQAAFNTAALPSLTGDPNAPWRLVEASPPDWWNTAASNRFREATLDLSGNGTGDYTILGHGGSFGLAIDGEPSAALDPQTKVRSITLKCQTVVLKRSWLTLSLFTLGGWGIDGQSPGICSSGAVDSNDGLLPLIPVCILVGADIVVNADWGPADEQKLAAAADRSVSLGPFPVSAPPTASLLYLVGVVSYLTPFSPRG